MKASKIILFAALLISYYGCACSRTEKQTAVQQRDEGASVLKNQYDKIPSDIITKADQVIIRKTGEDFFKKNIKLNSDKSIEIPEGYYFSYSFRITGKEYIDEEISFILDKKGNLKAGFEISGIPDCTKNTSCGFEISEEKAIEAARSAGLQEGVKDWVTSFEWDPRSGMYVWLVKNTLSESSGSHGKRGKGETVLIDPNTGEVISKTEWKVL